MKLHKDDIENGWAVAYFYDTHIRLWTVYLIDPEGNQVGDAQYCDKAGLAGAKEFAGYLYNYEIKTWTVPAKTIKDAARTMLANPYGSWGACTFDLADAAGYVIPWKTDEHGTRGRSADRIAFKIANAAQARIKALVKRYKRFAHHMKEVRHNWQQDESSRASYADNSVEIDEVSQLTGERRRVFLVQPHGDACF